MHISGKLIGFVFSINLDELMKVEKNEKNHKIMFFKGNFIFDDKCNLTFRPKYSPRYVYSIMLTGIPMRA